MIGVLVRLIGWTAPLSKRNWAEAMKAEIASIPDPRAALLYATGCLWAALRFRLKFEGELQFASFTSRGSLPNIFAIQAASGVCAVAIGIFYLLTVKAPSLTVVMNIAASLVGLLILFGIRGTPALSPRSTTVAALGIAAALLLTALFGESVEGASRWVKAGPIFVQTSLLLLPLSLLLFARVSNSWTTTAMIVAAIAMGLQPDRAMASALFAGLSVLYVVRRTPETGVALGAAGGALLATFLQADRLPAAPYVDHILWSSFSVHPLLGAALWLGSGLLFLPVLLSRSSETLPERLAFAACWAAIVGAAAFGAYPTPVVGYGGAAIVGYFLCLSALRPCPTSGMSAAQSSGSANETRSREFETDENSARSRARHGYSRSQSCALA